MADQVAPAMAAATEGEGEGDVEMSGTAHVLNGNNEMATETETATATTHNPEATPPPPPPPASTSSTFEFNNADDADGSNHINNNTNNNNNILPLPPTSSPAGSPAAKMKSGPNKKKGTAATTKKTGPKRSRRGGPKSAKSKANSGKGSRGDNTNNNDGNGDNSSDDDDDDETDNGPYCLCRGPDDHRWMISCDVCEDWFHGECVDLSKDVGERLVERFVCPNCTDGVLHYTKYRKTCSLPGCKNPARLYTKDESDRSVFCSNEHCDAWWAAMISTLPTKDASKKALQVLTQEDFLGLVAATADAGGWKLGDKPFGNIDNLWSNGLPTRPDVLSPEQKTFLQTSAAERLALGNEIVQYKKMMQLLDWANARRQAAVEAGKFTKDSCGYDFRLDTVTCRVQFAAWLETPEGQAVFKAGRLDAPSSTHSHPDKHNDNNRMDADGEEEDPLTRGTCDRKRCKPHNGWYKLLMSAVRVLVKETATAAANKLEMEEAMRSAAEARFERRQLENNYVEVLSEG